MLELKRKLLIGFLSLVGIMAISYGMANFALYRYERPTGQKDVENINTSGSFTARGNATSSFTNALVPMTTSTNNLYDIGEYDKAWRNIYASGTIYGANFIGNGSGLTGIAGGSFSTTSSLYAGYSSSTFTAADLVATSTIVMNRSTTNASGTLYIDSSGNIFTSGSISIPSVFMVNTSGNIQTSGTLTVASVGTLTTSTIYGGVSLGGSIGLNVMSSNNGGDFRTVGIGTNNPIIGSSLDVFTGDTANNPFFRSNSYAFQRVWGEYDNGSAQFAALDFGFGNTGGNPNHSWYLGTDSDTNLSIGYRTGSWGAPGDLDLFVMTPTGEITVSQGIKNGGDNASDLGAQANRWRNGYFSNSLNSSSSIFSQNNFAIAKSTTNASGTFYIDSSGNVSASGTGTFFTGGSANKAMCWKNAVTLGYCSSVVAVDGSCTCN